MRDFDFGKQIFQALLILASDMDGVFHGFKFSGFFRVVPAT
jgi:hypothetical protein